ncbi:MAG: hypothetical protein OXF20_13050 [Gammaproteobacteria bacterium]|nr:hypothetical protein [Gammaproteobacteria bacterium]
MTCPDRPSGRSVPEATASLSLPLRLRGAGSCRAAGDPDAALTGNAFRVSFTDARRMSGGLAQPLDAGHEPCRGGNRAGVVQLDP